MLVFLWLGALVGKNDSGVNFTPTFVYVYFWIFMPIVVVLFGNVWSVLSPWRAGARGLGWTLGRLRALATARRSSTRTGSGGGRPRCCSSPS